MNSSNISKDIYKPKFFINKKENIILESLKGLTMSQKNLFFYQDLNVIVDKNQLEQNKVRIICGGGSGHEPAHSGFVGEGMLTAAVCGDIYSSPSYKNIQKTIDLIYSPKGIFILIKNYGGDIINFTLAAEIAKSEGKKVEILIVDDDISLTNLNEIKSEGEEYNKRRGLCGIVYLYKILGSMCHEGASFEEILEYGKSIIPSLYTLGISLTSSITPFTVEKDSVENIKFSECEIGLGIHGERGKERIGYKDVNQLLTYCFEIFENNMPKNIFSEGETRNFNVVINNLGSCTDIEMGIILYSFVQLIETKYKERINILRYFSGRFMSSLDMRGFSITLVDLDNDEKIRNNIDFINHHLDSVNEIGIFKSINLNEKNYQSRFIKNEESNEKIIYENKNSIIFILLQNLSKFLINQCEYFNHLDKEVADGDLGIGVERGCSIILKNLQFYNFENKLKNSLKKIGNLIASNYGGTSGPLIASFIIRGSDFLFEEEKDNNIKNWANFFVEGTKMMQNLGKAKLNERTMMDILIPVGEILTNHSDSESDKLNFISLVNELEIRIPQILEKVKNMVCKKGRSSYQQGKEIGKDDPGCVLVAEILKFIIRNFNEKK